MLKNRKIWGLNPIKILIILSIMGGVIIIPYIVNILSNLFWGYPTAGNLVIQWISGFMFIMTYGILCLFLVCILVFFLIVVIDFYGTIKETYTRIMLWLKN